MRGLRPDERDARRCYPVRLCDVPADERHKAARRLCREAIDETEKVELLYAALFPSERVYWLSAKGPA